jgi:serine/threonine-protein kinase ATR
MTRGAASSTQVDSRSNLRRNDEPPPSTRAAQIVQNLTTTNGEPQQRDRESFQQLLAEILGNGDGTDAEIGINDSDIDGNYKLVDVVTRVGLDVLLRDDPFSETDPLIIQAINSIAVIKLTVQRTPFILFYSSSLTPSDNGRPRVSLVWWLLPKLMALMGLPKAVDLQKQLVDLFYFVLDTARKHSGMWKNRLDLYEYIKACVEGKLLPLRYTRK